MVTVSKMPYRMSYHEDGKGKAYAKNNAVAIALAQRRGVGARHCS